MVASLKLAFADHDLVAAPSRVGLDNLQMQRHPFDGETGARARYAGGGRYPIDGLADTLQRVG